MRKSILLLGICFILCSCPEVGDTDIYDYSIVNSSHKTVTMFLYKNDLRDISSKVTLQHGEKLQKRFEASKPASGLSMWALLILKQADLLVISKLSLIIIKK